jgi:hypothetical protein
MRQSGDDHRINAERGQRRRFNFRLVSAIVIGALSSMLNAASAATQVSGAQDDLQIQVQNASIREVFDAMSAKLHLTYKIPRNIGVDHELTGVYSGTISQVLARILDDNDYVVEKSNQGYKVVVFRRSGTIVKHSASQAVVSESAAVPSEVSKPVAARPPIVPSSSPSPPPLSSYVSANELGTTGQTANP